LTYTIGLERGDLNYSELEQNYRRQYQEMADHMATRGIVLSPYNPKLDRYYRAAAEGWLLNYVARFNGEAIGHCNVYLTNDVRSGDPVAVEDTVWVQPSHRNGLGRKLVKYVLNDLKGRGVRRFLISAATDPRAANLWRRLGFSEVSLQMSYEF
jgi:ribosomal protein S18 acetylase RimI-like enzyme